MRKLLIGLLVIAVGCGGDSTGPRADISGRWTYNATNVAGSGVSCNISSVSMTLAQSGSTFTGAVASGLVTCSASGSSFSDNLGNDVVANGQINGNAVQFDIGTSDVHNTGTVSGNSMSGTISLRVNTGSTTVVLTGNFAAVKQ
jgi:hypothetical protein